MLDYIGLTPTFRPFQGPLNVGSTAFEIPVTEIESPNALPEGTDVSTIKARVFYPTPKTSHKTSKPIWWLQEPQNEALASYVRFWGTSERVANAIGHIPSFIKRTKIPAISDAPLQESPSESKQWPVVIFSHGLGGSFHAYSYLVGTLASCGMVVFAIEHRDRSTPATFIHGPDGQRKIQQYRKLPHEPTPEVLGQRNEQLTTRMAELDMLYAIIDQLNRGKRFTNYLPGGQGMKVGESPIFSSNLDMRPSKVIWMGHSFGAATMVQFLKSIFWTRSLPNRNPGEKMSRTSYAPVANGQLEEQVTPHSPTILLDLWTMPLRAAAAEWLYERPLPCYADARRPTSSVLAVISEQFYNWKEIRERTKYILSGKPEDSGIEIQERDEKVKGGAKLYFCKGSAHLSQSDFGVLFPFSNRRFLGTIDPDRIVNLNVRAILQLLRQNGYSVSPVRPAAEDIKIRNQYEDEDAVQSDDKLILESNGELKNWSSLPLV